MKIHHSELDPDAKDLLICDDCGSDSIVSNGDCGGCSECYSIESYSTAYLGLDGEVYKDSEIDWSDNV